MRGNQLNRTLGLYAPGLVGLIDGLQDKGLVTRGRSGTDHRRYVLLLTKPGRELIRKADLVVSALEGELLSCISVLEGSVLKNLDKWVLSAWE